jgi:hypothetical protein
LCFSLVAPKAQNQIKLRNPFDVFNGNLYRLKPRITHPRRPVLTSEGIKRSESTPETIMKKIEPSKRQFAVNLVCLALLFVAGFASAQVTVTTLNQFGQANVWPFTPTWVVDQTDSLINGLTPGTAVGNFSLEIAGRDVTSLTVNTNLTLGIIQPSTTTSTNYVTYGNGSGAGSLLIYTLPANANGYNLTNITVYGGWANNGRDQQAYTVMYSTVANPTNFIYLATVNYNPSVSANTASAIQAIISNATGGSIATNVAAVQFVLNFPSVENGYCGIAAITAGGAPASAAGPTISVTAATQLGTANTWPFTPSWTIETDSLISGNTTEAGNVTASGNFSLEVAGRVVDSLTAPGGSLTLDEVTGTSGTTTSPNYLTCGGGSGSGSSIIYTLTNSPNGSDITNVIVYNGWADNGRFGQYYTVSYSTVSAPTTYIPITTIYYLPSVAGNTPAANRVAIAMSTGAPLGKNVGNLKFDFTSPPNAGSFNNGYQGYAQIIVEGTNSTPPPVPPSPYLTQDTLPSYAETVVGDQVIFTAAFSNVPPASLQWQVIGTNGLTTNDISGETNATLTLNDLQLTNSGSYRLKAVNATNGAAAPSYTTAAPLAVGSVPAAVNNVIVEYAGQCGLGAAGTSTNFYPTWTVNITNDLIYGFPTTASGPGTATAGNGNYGLGQANGDPTVLNDGSIGYINYWPNVGGSPALVSCGSSADNPGTSMTYTLITDSAPNGFDLTNIVVYGGWGDAGRNEQKYQVLYSTVANPTAFNNLLTVDYNPNDPNNTQSATRTTLVPANGVLAQNVAAVEINWGLQGAPPKNGWEGYSEIIINGTPSAPKPVLTQDVTPLSAEDVMGSSLTLTANFSGATSFQWQKNGTNISDATSPTLTLNNLQPTDAATNGGYRLVASNASGIAMTRECAVVVDPVPAAVNNVITAIAYQTSDLSSFSPTWDTSSLSSSLILYQNPPSGGFGTGDFTDPDGNPVSHDLAGGLPVLTDGNYGTIVSGGPHPAFATGGPNAGQYVIYTLGPSANGYDITNILIAGGWNDNGRNSQYYTVSYSTVANPTMFVPLVVVETNLTAYGANDETTVRATMTPATGVLASNVYAIQVDFTVPAGVPNGYSGYSEIGVFGLPSAAAPPAGPVITTAHEETNNIWAPETPNLIANQLPSSTGPGSFTLEGCNETNLTDGILGFGAAFGASCGAETDAVPYIIFSSASGWNLTNIVVYTLWHDYGRDGQYYNVSYSTVSAPTTFLPLASVAYNPFVIQDGRASGNRVAIAPPVGQFLLASNVAAVKFDFTPQGIQDFGWSGYTEIILQGTNLSSTIVFPPTFGKPTLSAGNLILTGAGGTPNQGYTLLTATNLTPPVNWTTNGTGSLDGAGSFSNAVPVTATPPAQFFRLRLP